MAVWHCEGYILGNTGICKGHNIYCKTQAEVDNYMRSKKVGSFKEYSYIRSDNVSKNAYQTACIHIGLPYNKATEVDFVMYKNNDIDPDRWYYGKVTEREYVNVNSTRLYFEFDYWLTWHEELNAGIKRCLVARNHVYERDDWKGNQPSYKYQMPESYSMPMFEYTDDENNLANANVFKELKPQGFLIYATTDKSGKYDYTAQNVVNGSPTALYVEGAGDYSMLGQLISLYNENFPLIDTSSPDNIQAVTYVPIEIATPFVGNINGVQTDVIEKIITIKRPNRDTLKRFDSKPFNNSKCFMTPYIVNIAKTFRGETISLNGEIFAESSSGTIYGKLQYCGGVDSHYKCVFSDKSQTDEKYETRFINLPDYPQISVHSDSFTQYMGRQFLGDAVKTGIDVCYAVAGSKINPLIGIGGISGVASDLSSIVTNMSAPDKAVGTSTPMDSAAYDTYRVVFYVRRPSIENLTAFDDYLSCYGYALNEFRQPNLCVRKNWTYVQTNNAVVVASLPHKAIEQVESMLNGGTTFWNVKNCAVGDYKTENPDNE